MTYPYRFFMNPFLSVTRYSYKKTLTLGVDHKAKLIYRQADPVVAALLATYGPVLDAYMTVDSNLNALLGGYKAKTQTVEELFEVLSNEKLPYWEGQVFYFYPLGTAGATDIFANKRKPFNDGTYEQRIQAIRTLGEKCAVTLNLAAVSANILAFHTQIESARLMQQSDGEAAVAAQRTLRETARILLCNELYGNMGMLMHKHRENPVAVGDYFDMELLRTNDNDEPPIYEAFAPIGISEINPDFELANPTTDTLIKIKNLSAGTQVLSFYFSVINNMPPMPPMVLVLNAEQEQTVNLGQLGFPNQFFLVQNTGPTAGKFSIEVVEE